MDAADFPDRVEQSVATELDRIGSSKRLVALTSADLEAETVLRTAAASEAAAADVFAEWAADAEDDGTSADASELFAAVAEREREHYDRVVGELDSDVESAPGAVHDYLAGLDDPVAKAGGLVGRGLVADRTLTQFVSFFVNEADERRADLFRDLKVDTAVDTESAAELLGDLCEDDADWARAEDAATRAVSVAYDEYVAALGELGVDAKSVC